MNTHRLVRVVAVGQVTRLCEDEEYGQYNPGSNHGRCSDGDLAQWLGEISPACCGENFEHCMFCEEAQSGGSVDCDGDDMFNTAPTIDGTQDGHQYCARECAPLIEELYAECHPRLTTMGLAEGLQSFLGTCQGMGGHRRSLITMPSDSAQEAQVDMGFTKAKPRFSYPYGQTLEARDFSFP